MAVTVHLLGFRALAEMSHLAACQAVWQLRQSTLSGGLQHCLVKDYGSCSKLHSSCCCSKLLRHYMPY